MIPKHPMLPLMTRLEWIAEGERRFGPDPLRWRFVCPACGHVATVQDWKDNEAPEEAVAYSCIGRWTSSLPIPREAFGGNGPGPCNYAGGGLFRLNPQPVTDGENKVRHVFAFAEPAPGGSS